MRSEGSRQVMQGPKVKVRILELNEFLGCSEPSGGII